MAAPWCNPVTWQQIEWTARLEQSLPRSLPETAAMNGKSAYTIVPPAARAVQDEWGMFDPNQAGLQAAFRAVRALDGPPASGDPFVAGGESDEPSPSNEADATGPFSALHRPPHVPVFGGAIDRTGRGHRAQPPAGSTCVLPHVAATDDIVYDLTEPEPPCPRQQKPVERGTAYTLEFPTRCPQCCTEITTVRVSRLLRTQVSFTSTLPRKGYIIVCPECDGILSAELSGLI
jgi:hypothetical protein